MSTFTLDKRTEEAAIFYGPLLSDTVLFKGFQGAELIEALSYFQARFESFKKGEILHQSGEALTAFGLVLSGAVQALSDDLDGNRMIMAGVGPGGTFGESLAFLKIQDSAVYVMAQENTEILWLTPSVLFLPGQGSLALELKTRFTAMLAKRALAMNDRIQILSKLRLREKLMTYFTELSREQKSHVLTLPFDREDMAAYIGTNRSALSRELSRMKQEGIIDYEGRTVRILKH